MTNATPNAKNDAVNHPSHYTQYPVEVIELTRCMNFGRGNAVKYIARAGFKGGPEKELQDLEKAAWYIADEINTLKQKLAAKKLADITAPAIPGSSISSSSFVQLDVINSDGAKG